MPRLDVILEDVEVGFPRVEVTGNLFLLDEHLDRSTGRTSSVLGLRWVYGSPEEYVRPEGAKKRITSYCRLKQRDDRNDCLFIRESIFLFSVLWNKLVRPGLDRKDAASTSYATGDVGE